LRRLVTLLGPAATVEMTSYGDEAPDGNATTPSLPEPVAAGTTRETDDSAAARRVLVFQSASDA
jgi:hypothetical protein